MNKGLINNFEDLIKSFDKNLYYDYLKILDIYKFFIETVQDFSIEDQLEIISFFYKKVLNPNYCLYDILISKDKFVFSNNKFKEKVFLLSLEYFQNRILYQMSHREAINSIETNNCNYPNLLIAFLKNNSETLENIFEINKDLFHEQLEKLTHERDFFEIYSGTYCDAILIKKNFFKDFSPSLFSGAGLIVRFCKLGQIGFKKHNILLNENEALITRGLSLGEYKVLTHDVHYLTIQIKEKFFKDFNVTLDQCLIRKLPWKIDDESFAFFHNFNQLKNHKILILNFLSKIVLELLNEHHKIDFKVLSNDNILKIVEFIDENLEKDISVNQIQKEFYLNKNNLSELFKINFGVSPLKFILNKKLERASVLLLETNLSITEIALKLNFSNLGKFSSSFKNKYFYTPLQFKKKFEKLRK
ncbi:helix-turn-helix transcriptional regulator [Cetobacterium sp. SF1]|uniref:helix-turn-helix transcriptional regulator n=1 Tax=Cetobacterium sp. SF1 TaxID=3417654 RepID=UPI003CF38D7C